MFPNNAEIDFAWIRKIVFGDVVSLVSTGVRKSIGKAILIAVLANGKLTVTIAVEPKHSDSGLTDEMLNQVVQQEFRVLQKGQ
jgi:hypothetical protein